MPRLSSAKRTALDTAWPPDCFGKWGWRAPERAEGEWARHPMLSRTPRAPKGTRSAQPRTGDRAVFRLESPFRLDIDWTEFGGCPPCHVPKGREEKQSPERRQLVAAFRHGFWLRGVQPLSDRWWLRGRWLFSQPQMPNV